MKSVFEQSTRDELVTRIHSVSENSTAQWGKMNVFQMLRHCTIWDEWVLSKNQTGKYLLAACLAAWL